jgi:hypothetical protein
VPYRIEQLLVFGRFIYFLTLMPTGIKSENAEFDPDFNVPLGLARNAWFGGRVISPNAGASWL